MSPAGAPRRHSTAPPKRRRPHPGVACELRRQGRARSRAPRHRGRPRRPMPRAPARIDPPAHATSDDQRPTPTHRRTPIASDVQRYGQFVCGTSTAVSGLIRNGGGLLASVSSTPCKIPMASGLAGSFFPADYDFEGAERSEGGQPWTAWPLCTMVPSRIPG